MTLDNLVVPKLEIDLFGEKWNCEFKLRNFAVLRNECGITEDELLKGLMQKDLLHIAYAIWASTLVFAPFDITNPLKYEKSMSLEKILELNLAELQAACNQVVKAMEAYLPKPTEQELAKKKTVKKKATK